MARPRLHALHVWAALWRVRFLHELHYRANLVLNLLKVSIDVVVGWVTIRLVFDQVDALHGWTEPELLVVLGTYTLLDAVMRSVVLPSMWAVVRDVESRAFDGVLVMPTDVQLYVTARELSVWDLSGVVVGAGLVVYGAGRVGGVGVLDRLAYLAVLPVGGVIVYSFFLAVTSLAFRLVDLNDFLFRLSQGASYAGRWPLGVYSGWLRVALTAIVPIGVAVTIPSSVLLGRLSVGWLAAAAAFGAAVLAASRWVFVRGLRAYSGASA